MADDIVSEEWRVVPDWPDYEVSDLGRVRRCKPTYFKNPKNGRIYERIKAGTFLKGSTKPKTGYPSVTLHDGAGRKADINVHTLVCRTFHGPAPSPKHEVAHEDGVRTNNRKGNLRWTTHKENGADMIGHGRTLRGTKHHFSKLSEDDVHAIRALADGGAPKTALSRQYGIALGTVKTIARRKIWNWLPERQS